MYATVRYHLLQTFIQTINNKLNMFCIRSIGETVLQWFLSTQDATMPLARKLQ